MKAKADFLVSQKNIFILWLFCLLLTRFPLLYTDFSHINEVFFALGTKMWLQGEVPYADFVTNKSLGIYYFYALASLLSGKLGVVSLFSIHLATLFVSFLTTLFIYKIAFKLYSENTAIWASLLFIFFSANYFPNIHSSNIELLFLLPYTLSSYFILRHAKILRAQNFFFSGFFFSAALLILPQALILLPVQLIYFLFIVPRSQIWTYKKGFSSSLFFLLGCLPLPLMMGTHLYLLGALDDFYSWVLPQYLNLLKPHGLNLKSTSHFFSKLSPFLFFILGTFLIWLLCLQRMIYFFKNRRVIPLHSKLQENYLIFCLLFSFLFFYPYFLIFFPVLCILAAANLETWPPERWRKYKTAFGLALIVPTLFFTLLRFNRNDFNLELHRSYGLYLKNLTQAQDRIFIWGDAPAIYWYSNRLPASRFLNTEIEEKKESEFWKMFWDDFEKHPPQLISDQGKVPLGSYPDPTLWVYVQKNYEELEPFLGKRIFKRKLD